LYGGQQAEQVSMQLWLPGGPTALMNPDRWFAPNELITSLQQALSSRTERGRVFLDMPYADVFAWYMLMNMDETRYGGCGDIDLNLTFVEWRDLIVQTTSDIASGTAPSEQSKNPVTASPPPGEQATPSTESAQYTLSEDDTLWALADKYYGDGSRWREIWDANSDVITDPNTLIPGTAITIPQSSGSGGSGGGGGEAFTP
jgi:hypothetical protein